ncbi:ankyrin repeat-containing protein BDA1 isoform X2 [Spinacia oleracea]|uniref:Ankyrin repeat-containing protein BDA1 isoform X2 n=1 Tax=Spinacia oleracea TaxID=3562 RepID=A0ABM3RTJ1_SPIOL|nr:ankyrin repeat-containing protein BDA1-like isoform X2 [Spinacia oleracea]
MEKERDKSESVVTVLYEAALTGDVPSMLNLLEQDQFILERCIIEKSCHFMQSPLHVAVNMGHIQFVREILRRKPQFAEVVDRLRRSSPLHIACAIKGRLEIVNILVEEKPNMCFAQDQDGRTPIHVAVVNGNVEVMEVLLKEKHQAAWERTMGGETVLHLCVKNNQLDALKSLVNKTDDPELLNFADSNGDTALHLAVAYKESEMVECLLAQNKIAKDVRNKKEKTIVDIHKETNKGSEADKKIDRLLKKYKAKPAKYGLKRQTENKWLEEQNTALMVVAASIATMAFQVGMNPPGGVWQDNNNGHEAATYLLAIGYVTPNVINKASLVNDAMDYSVEVWLWLVAVILLGHGVLFILKLIGHDRRQKIREFYKTHFVKPVEAVPKRVLESQITCPIV